MMWACMYCPMEFVIDLLKRDTVDVNLRSSTYFDTALNRAIVCGRNEIVVELLKCDSIDVNRRNVFGGVHP